MKKIKKHIGYYENGTIHYEIWYIDDGKPVENIWDKKFHREDGPAWIRYDGRENVTYEAYHINDKRHREDGPAHIGYDMQGNVEFEYYWLDGMEIDKDEWLKRTSKLGKGLY